MAAKSYGCDEVSEPESVVEMVERAFLWVRGSYPLRTDVDCVNGISVLLHYVILFISNRRKYDAYKELSHGGELQY